MARKRFCGGASAKQRSGYVEPGVVWGRRRRLREFCWRSFSSSSSFVSFFFLNLFGSPRSRSLFHCPQGRLFVVEQQPTKKKTHARITLQVLGTPLYLSVSLSVSVCAPRSRAHDPGSLSGSLTRNALPPDDKFARAKKKKINKKTILFFFNSSHTPSVIRAHSNVPVSDMASINVTILRGVARCARITRTTNSSSIKIVLTAS